MIGNNRKLLAVTALLLAVLLAGCSIEDIPLVGEIFKPAQPQAVGTLPAPETTMPAATMTPQPQATQPVYTEPAETEPPVVYYWVRADGGLNVRKGPGQNHDVVGRLDNGAQVVPLEWENGWAYIEYPLKGWCSGDYLVETRPETNRNPGVRWIHTSVQLYQGPSFDYEEDCYAEAGLRVNVVEWYGEWAHLEKNGWSIGWCKAEWLTEKDPYPTRDENALLSRRTPYDKRLVGSWMIVTDYVRGEGAHAGELELKSDGTFSHTMNWYQNSGAGYWYMPGDYDFSWWVGEYTFDGETLVLTYLGLAGEATLYERNGPPIRSDIYWHNIYKKVVLSVTFTDEGFVVDAPWSLPVHGQSLDGSSNTLSTFYRIDDYGDVGTTMQKYLK